MWTKVCICELCEMRIYIYIYICEIRPCLCEMCIYMYMWNHMWNVYIHIYVKSDPSKRPTDSEYVERDLYTWKGPITRKKDLLKHLLIGNHASGPIGLWLRFKCAVYEKRSAYAENTYWKTYEHSFVCQVQIDRGWGSGVQYMKRDLYMWKRLIKKTYGLSQSNLRSNRIVAKVQMFKEQKFREDVC